MLLDTVAYRALLLAPTRGKLRERGNAMSWRVAVALIVAALFVPSAARAVRCNRSRGLVARKLFYHPYGGTLSDSSSAPLRWKFTSQEVDSETGLYNYGPASMIPSWADSSALILPFQAPTTHRR